jgi:hypothetical protein
MVAKNITDVTGEVFGLLNPLSQEDRKRVVNAVFVLLGDPVADGASAATERTNASAFLADSSFGAKARHWLTQHRLTKERLEKVFYFQDGRADIHLATGIGASRREQTMNCYLLVGAKAYLETDIPTFADRDAIALCKHTQVYDKNNHTTNRKALGNCITGSREDGLTLTGPGLKAAAELLLKISGTPAA